MKLLTYRRVPAAHRISHCVLRWAVLRMVTSHQHGAFKPHHLGPISVHLHAFNGSMVSTHLTEVLTTHMPPTHATCGRTMTPFSCTIMHGHMGFQQGVTTLREPGLPVLARVMLINPLHLSIVAHEACRPIYGLNNRTSGFHFLLVKAQPVREKLQLVH